MNILVIMNPVSGKGDHEERRERLEHYLEEAGVRFEIRETGGEGDAFRWAKDSEGFDRVLVSGGDGTVMEAMSGLIESEREVPLAQLPLGTANLLAQALDVPRDLDEALEVAVTGLAIRMDVGYLEGRDRYFALVAGAGWDAQLIEDATRPMKDRFGFFAYLLTGVANLFKLHESRITLTMDDKVERFSAHTVMVVNVGEMAEMGLELAEGITPHDGKLDLAVITPHNAIGLARLLWRLLWGKLKDGRDVRFFTVTRARLEADPPLKVEIDGEPIGTTPIEVRAVPDGALLVVPRSYVERHGLEAVELPSAAVPPTA